MTWLRSASDTPTPFEGVLGLRPELLAAYRDFYGRLWDDRLVAPRLLELCRLRVALLHDCQAELAVRHETAGVAAEEVAALEQWQRNDCFTPVERAALAIADKMPWRQHEISDVEVAALRRHLPEAEAVALVLAIGLFDSHCRLRTVLGIEPRRQTVAAPASKRGRLY